MVLCVFSSLSFITNSIAAYLYGEYIYSGLFGGLCITSIMFHGFRWYNSPTHLLTYSPTHLLTYSKIDGLYYAYIIDQLFVYSIAIAGGCLVYKKSKNTEPSIYSVMCSICIVSTFVLTLLLYYYGYIREIFSFDPNPDVSEKWHCMIHWIASLGHHCILLL
jgi:hypothetical protein